MTGATDNPRKRAVRIEVGERQDLDERAVLEGDADFLRQRLGLPRENVADDHLVARELRVIPCDRRRSVRRTSHDSAHAAAAGVPV